LEEEMRTFRNFLQVVAVLLVVAAVALAAPRPVSAQAPSCRSVVDAVNAKEATLSLKANSNEFYTNPLDYVLKNLTGQQLDLCFPAGLTMISGDSANQNLVLTRTILVTVAPNGEKRGDLSADCMNLSKHAPGFGAGFSVGGMAQGDLLRVIQAIDKRSAQGRLGSQIAIWAVTDGLTLEDIGNSGSNSDTAQMLQVISPLLCLAGDDIDLAQSLLTESGSAARLFAENSGGAAGFCASHGLPANLDEFVQTFAKLGAVSIIAICGGCCLGFVILIALIVGLVALVRSRRKNPAQP
jgi:hypothetical protein